MGSDDISRGRTLEILAGGEEGRLALPCFGFCSGQAELRGDARIRGTSCMQSPMPLCLLPDPWSSQPLLEEGRELASPQSHRDSCSGGRVTVALRVLALPELRGGEGVGWAKQWPAGQLPHTCLQKRQMDTLHQQQLLRDVISTHAQAYHTHTHVHSHTCTGVHAHSHRFTGTHAQAHAGAHTQIHRSTCTRTLIHTQVCTHAVTDSQADAQLHTGLQPRYGP